MTLPQRHIQELVPAQRNLKM